MVNKDLNKFKEELLEDDVYYAKFATPLKSAQQLKQEHLRQISQALDLKPMSEAFNAAAEIIQNRLPSYAAKEIADQAFEELANSAEHFEKSMRRLSQSGESVGAPSMQQMWGLSNQTMLVVYELGYTIFQKGDHQEAYSLFMFLTALAPHISGYWHALGLSLEKLERLQEAFEYYKAGAALHPAYEALKVRARVCAEQLNYSTDSLQ